MDSDAQEDQVSASTHPSVRKLMAGNDRYLAGGSPVKADEESSLRTSLSNLGQKPWAVLLSCSDSRVPVERIFDVGPGELFVVRAAGNICGNPIGGLLGSAEYGVQHLGSPLVMVLGHTKCGAVSAAVRCSKTGAVPGESLGRNLGAVVQCISKPAGDALEAARPTTPEQIERAILLNVFNQIELLLTESDVIRQAVRDERLEVQGGIYDISTGVVTFLGQHAGQDKIMRGNRKTTVRTAFDTSMAAPAALTLLKNGNARYVQGNIENKIVDSEMRQELAQLGQRPYAAVLGCADSRVPLDYIFDAVPGSLFVLRNAGSTCGATAGGIIGSIEYGVGHLKSQLLLVLGHTKCGAVAAAVDAHLAGGEAPAKADPLQLLLANLKEPVAKAAKQGRGREKPDLVELAIELNVWHTVEQLLARSTALKDAVAVGTLQIHGGVYDLVSGRVKFMGQHPRLVELMADETDDTHPGVTLNLTNDWSGKKGCCEDCEDCPPPPQPVAVVPAGGEVGRRPSTPKYAWTDDDVEAGKGAGKEGMFSPEGWQEYFRSLLECSLHLETKHGKQHVKDIVLDKNNWIAGITVALVSVPLSLSLGIASGTTPVRGLATAVFGGICAAIFGDSNYNVVAPAGALSGMLMSYAVQWGDDALPWISLISSVICLVFLVLRIDVYMLMMPKSVFEGFTLGVALIIGLNQINLACGLRPVEMHKLFVTNIVESLKLLGETKAASIILFSITAPLLWFLMWKVPKVPWMVIVPVVTIPLGVLCDHGHISIELLTLKSRYDVLKPEEFVQPLRSTSASFWDLLIPSLSVAIVALVETLMSAKTAAASVDRGFCQIREMRGLVVAHAVCGATGAIPPSGFSIHTSLNASLGATHRFAQGLNAVVVAIISLALMPVFSYMPQATIASILVVAAIRMTPMKYMMALWLEDKLALALCIVTALVCVGRDPVIGLGVGTVLAFLAAAEKALTANFVDIGSKPAAGGKKSYRVEVKGAITYLNAEALMGRMWKVEFASDVNLDLAGVRQVDHDGAVALGKLTQSWTESEPDCHLRITGVGPAIYAPLSKLEWFATAELQGRVKAA